MDTVPPHLWTRLEKSITFSPLTRRRTIRGADRILIVSNSSNQTRFTKPDIHKMDTNACLASAHFINLYHLFTPTIDSLKTKCLLLFLITCNYTLQNRNGQVIFRNFLNNLKIQFPLPESIKK